MAPTPDELGRQARTLAHLKPAQILYRLRVQAQRRLVARDPDRFTQRWQVAIGTRSALPDEFEAIDASILARRWSPQDLAAGTFELLNDRRDLGTPVDWDPAEVSQLWSFHLHYWEWAWALAGDGGPTARGTFARHLESWKTQTTFGAWDGWAPYPASLRAWVLVNVHRSLAVGTAVEDPMVELIALHAGFLEHNMELDVGGNHIIKNIKGLLGCAVFLGDQRLIDLALQHLQRELAVQVLADGGHYELSPSYHCQVLADLIDMAELLAADDRTPPGDLGDAVDAMRRWLGVMVLPDGGLPLLNDSEPVDPKLIDLLGPVRPDYRALTVLADTGYAVAKVGPLHLVADVGQPGPPSPPGHIHADCLSFTLHVHGVETIVDTGTSEYGSGPRRAYERSTAAHSTVEIDGCDQTEVFGAFRAGRRARATLERAELRPDGTVEITASHDGYRHLPGKPVHRRTWQITPDQITLVDAINGSGLHTAASRIHQPVGSEGRDAGPTVAVTIDAQALRADGTTLEIHAETTDSTVSRGFGSLVPALTHFTSVEAELPITVRTTIAVPT